MSDWVILLCTACIENLVAFTAQHLAQVYFLGVSDFQQAFEFLDFERFAANLTCSDGTVKTQILTTFRYLGHKVYNIYDIKTRSTPYVSQMHIQTRLSSYQCFNKRPWTHWPSRNHEKPLYCTPLLPIHYGSLLLWLRPELNLIFSLASRTGEQ